MDDAFKYIRDNGIDSEISYPYRGHVRTCVVCVCNLCYDRMRLAALNKQMSLPMILVLLTSRVRMKLT